MTDNDIDLFICPDCGARSAHPTDVAEGYCGACHDWTGGPAGADVAAGSAARLGALLNADPTLTPARLRADFPNWRIWWATATGSWHAIRDEPSGRFEVSQHSPRRFHLEAKSLGYLAVLLLAQHAVDTTERDTAHSGDS